MSKKGVSDVIATVLIILLVLAAIIIVWQAVKGTVTSTTETVAAKAKCIGVTLNPVSYSCSNSTGVVTTSVSRGSDDAGAIQMKVVVDNTAEAETAAPSALGTLTAGTITTSATGKASITLKVAAIIDGNTCDPSDPITVTCTA
jgi:hypothetical protein